MDADQKPVQREIPYSRLECDALLKHRVRLPDTPWNDEAPRQIAGEQLRMLLLAIYTAGHEGKREAFPSYATIARMAGCSRSTAIRGIAALVRLGVLLIERRQFGRSRSSNRYVIVWTMLRERFSTDTLPLFWQGPPRAASGDDSLPAHDRPATSDPQLGSSTVRLGSGTVLLPQAHGAPTLGAPCAPNENVTVGQLLKTRTTSSQRRFTDEEWQAIRGLANALLDWALPGDDGPQLTDDDRELALKLATLEHDGLLPDAWIRSARRSLTRRYDQGRPPERPLGYLLASLETQAAHAGRRLGQMLKATAWPHGGNIMER
jgi:hypothetical protein